MNLGLTENTGDIPKEEQPGIIENYTQPENPEVKPEGLLPRKENYVYYVK